MRRWALILLLCVLLVATTFGLDLSIATGLSVKNAFLYLLMVGYFIQTAMSRNPRFELPAVLVTFALFCGYSMLSWFVAGFVVQPDYYRDIMGAAISLKGERVDHLIIFLLFFYGVSTTQDALGLIRVILWMLVLGNVLTVVDGFNIPDLGIIQQRDDGRLGGPMGESNQYGALLALTLPALIALLWDSPHTKRAAAVGAIFVSFIALMVAGSRGSFAGLILGGAFAVFVLRSIIPLRHVVLGTAVSVGVVTVTMVLFLRTQLFDELVGRLIEQTAAGDIYRVSSGRSDIWRFALERMIETPLSFLTGFGWNAYDNMRGFNAAPHSVYLATMFNLGLPGLALYLAFIYSIFATCLRAVHVATGIVRTHLAAFVFGFAALCVSVAFVDLYQPWVYIWAYVGVVMRLAIETTRESEAAAPKTARPLSLLGAARL